MKRFDWPAQLFRVVDEHRSRAFAWGVDDCCRFVARAIDAMTDGDVEQRIAAEYTDEQSAADLIAAHGGLQGAVTHFLGEPQEVRATRGDAVLFDGGGGDAVGICLGRQVVAMGPTGLRMIPREQIEFMAVWPTV